MIKIIIKIIKRMPFNNKRKNPKLKDIPMILMEKIIMNIN